MRRLLPPLNPLRTFEALARLGSIGAAAHELSVTHGAVSHQVRTLEESLGTHLFHRDKRSLRLTQAGQLYSQNVRQALNLIAESTLKLSIPSGEGRLYVTCPPTLATCWLAKELRDFRRQFPDIRLNIKPQNLDHQNISGASYDVAIIYGNGDWGDRSVRRLTAIEMYPVCNPRFFSDGESPRQVSDFRGEWLLHEDDGGNWKRWLASVGVRVEGFADGTYLWGAHLAIEAAASGLGIAVGDDIVCANYFQQGRLVRLFDTSVPAPGAYYTVCEANRVDEPMIALFINWLEGRMHDAWLR
ncbi:LysR substrate-binding domain-containing protein [Pseudomonas sp. L13]|uniref:LysR substrate-binding domain-containing protein n=1 Tax=Pseudomonas sp. L13 TaxID=343985 RepID=UPI00137A005F|nr:LysR substrate-binding domain-containing protein [Pseudomonas sp. L13]NCE89189.1 LysR family transcriptional regulator [Pseudomonas sp. L13]